MGEMETEKAGDTCRLLREPEISRLSLATKPGVRLAS